MEKSPGGRKLSTLEAPDVDKWLVREDKTYMREDKSHGREDKWPVRVGSIVE